MGQIKILLFKLAIILTMHTSNTHGMYDSKNEIITPHLKLWDQCNANTKNPQKSYEMSCITQLNSVPPSKTNLNTDAKFLCERSNKTTPLQKQLIQKNTEFFWQQKTVHVQCKHNPRSHFSTFCKSKRNKNYTSL